MRRVTVAITDLSETITSTEFFNIAAGRLLRGDYDVSFTMRASAGAGAQTKEGSIEARMHLTVQAR